MQLKQSNEILQLKHELQLAQAEKVSRLDNSLYSPKLYNHYFRIAVMLSESSMIPQAYIGKPKDIFVAMAYGYQLGFPIEQALQDIAIIRGRPCLWGDGLLALAQNHPDCEYITESPILDKDGSVFGYRCVVKRKGYAEHIKDFTLADARKANLLGSATWKTYPERMLQMRARGFAIRDKFADALRGVRIAEIEREDENILDVTPSVTDITREPTLKPQKRKEQAILDLLAKNTGMQQDDKTIEDTAIDSPKLSDSSNQETASQDNEPVVLDALRECETDISNQGDAHLTDEQLDEITSLMIERGYDQQRTTKVLSVFDVLEVDQLSYSQAEYFLTKLRTK